MRVRDLMTNDPAVCLPEDPCAIAGEIMATRNCGFVPVVDSMERKRVVGVVTDRDLALHLIQAGRPPRELPVEACMTQEPRTISPEAELDEAVQLMETAAVHRLPVVEDGKLVGVLSLRDIACMAHEEHSSSSGLGATERQVAEVVEAIAVAR